MAVMNRIPKEIKQRLPQKSVKSLNGGEYPEKGFGIGGNTGGGKSMALAAILKTCFKEKAKANAPKMGHFNIARVLWSCWPDEVNYLRAHALDSDTAERILALQTVPLLILDDLGRERIRGSYAEDWAASQLDGIINHRYRHEMPILWTTNVPAAHLVVLYGSALVSRLTGDNPLIWFNDLPDMRAGI